MALRSSYDFPDRVFLKHQSKLTCDCNVFKFLRISLKGKQLMRFQSETPGFKFFRWSVDEALNLFPLITQSSRSDTHFLVTSEELVFFESTLKERREMTPVLPRDFFKQDLMHK